MAKEYNRKQRVGELIQRELASILLREFVVPDAGMVTVSGVDVSPDLSHAKVYISVLEPAVQARVLATLNAEATSLRYLLAQRIKNIRTTPRLSFIYDDSMAQGNRLSALIDAVNKG